jgi:hypothetical protein
MSRRPRHGKYLLAATTLMLCLSAHADCRLELELLSADLHGIKLTEQQAFELAPLIDEVLKRCRMGWEASALLYIAKAREVAGIPKRDELDLEGDDEKRDAPDH